MNIVVTGGTRGIGFAIANLFCSHATQIVITGKNADRVQQAVAELNRLQQAKVIGYTANLAIPSEAKTLAQTIIQQVGVVDVLVNNAGSFEPGNISNEAEGTLEHMMANNVYSAYYVTQGLLPTMMANKQGHIFNICSIASLKAYPNGGSYSISKFALHGFSQNLREELKQYGIKVTSVMPGAVYTDSWKNSGVDESRIMQANDIAKLILSASTLSAQACVEEIVIRPQLGDL